VVNRDNGYMLDRARQRAGDFMGVPGVQNQDRAIVESMGPILDRRKERLGTSDVAVIAARRILLRLARQLRDGHEPMAQSDGSIFRVRPFDAILPEPDFQRVLEAHKQALVSPVAPLPQPNGVATGEPAAAR
jgi:phthalate 4,5-dioxygenase oxygenase subunit